jgi:hypothetical protein
MVGNVMKGHDSVQSGHSIKLYYGVWHMPADTGKNYEKWIVLLYKLIVLFAKLIVLSTKLIVFSQN